MRTKWLTRAGICLALAAVGAGFVAGCGAVLANPCTRDLLIGGALTAALAALGQEISDATLRQLAGLTPGGDDDQAAQVTPGPAGPAGPEGPAGPQGPAGPAGPAGPQGPAGADGADGLDGAKGADGADGADGQDGADGADGQDGEDGRDGVDGQDGADGRDGADGKDGAPGEPGPQYFDTFIDEIYGMEALSINSLPTFHQSRGWKVAIPYRYQPGNPVTMRMFFYTRYQSLQSRPKPECQVFKLVTLRLRDGGTITHYGPEELFLTIDVPYVENPTLVEEDGRAWVKVFLVIDLPLNQTDGLAMPNDLLPGDMLGFGMEWVAPGCPDDGINWRLYGIEFFETAVGAAPPLGAAVTLDLPGCWCEGDAQ